MHFIYMTNGIPFPGDNGIPMMGWGLVKGMLLRDFKVTVVGLCNQNDKTCSQARIKNLTDLCYGVLEPVRAKFEKPIIVTSGYRSEKLCEAIKSSKTSQHTKGQAVDFEIAGVSNLEL